MFEFGNILFRSVEKEDLKMLHEWENDFELIMYSRCKPLNFVNMAQLEKQYEEWVKDEKELHFIIEVMDSKVAIGIARIRLGEWGNVRSADIGIYIGEKKKIELGLSLRSFF